MNALKVFLKTNIYYWPENFFFEEESMHAKGAYAVDIFDLHQIAFLYAHKVSKNILTSKHI